MNRAIRKRAAKLKKKADASLKKNKGDDFQSMANRLSDEQFIKVLEFFESPSHESLPELAVTLAKSLISATAETEQDLLDKHVSVAKRAEIDCGAGCSWCCHEPLQVSILDAISVAHFLRQNQDLPPRLAAYVANLAPFENQRERLKESFEPCPFLGADKRCGVYEARPVICRAFHSTDVKVCQDLVERKSKERSVPMYTQLFGFVGLRLTGARKALRELGIDDRPVVLATAVKLLIDDFDRVTEAWLKGEEVFESAVVLG